MKSMVNHKKQLALAVVKGKRVQLLLLQEEYVKRWKLHAHRQGKDPNDVPRTAYSDLIDDFVKRLDLEIKQIEGQDVVAREVESENV